ncbi:MAG: NIPSNAP family protein [Cyclobacteriaceae bacterium]|nr:NIPSNAP family protein [Cyclobacteriaceae bacterium]
MKMRHLLTLLLIMFVVPASGQTAPKNDPITLNEPIHQLRIYEIPKENRQAFHNRFRDHANRIMKKYGFNIVAIWESEYKERIEFVYLIEWTNQDSMTIAWNKFMADQEWKDIKALTSKEHGTFVNSIEDRTLKLTEYSPQVNLRKTNKKERFIKIKQ